MKTIMQRYQGLSLTVKASFWFVVCNAIQKATQIFTTPIYTRILTQTQYGEYTAFLSWIELAAILTTLDIFYSGYNVGMEKFRKDRDNYTTSMHGLCFVLTSVWVIIICLFAPIISPWIKMSVFQIRILMIYMYVFPIFQFWSARKKYDYQYRPLIIITTISSVLTIILGTLFAFAFKNKSDGVIIAKIIIEALVSVPLLFVSINGLKNLFNKFYWKYALKFNIPLIPHYMSTMVLNHSDRLMIVSLCNKSDAAVYSVAYSIAMLMTIIQNAINSAVIPWMYRKLREKTYVGIPKVSTIIIGAIAILNLCLLTIAPEAIRLISTSEYSSAAYVIPPVTFGVFLTGVYGFFVNVELFYNYNKFAAFASVFAAITNIILNYIFIPRFGYVAAGYTTFISYLILTVMHFWGIKRALSVEKIDYHEIINTKHIVCIISTFGVIELAVVLLYSQIIIRYAIICVVLGIIAFNYKKIIGLSKSILK